MSATTAAPRKLPLRLDIRKSLTTLPPKPDFVLPGLPTGSVGALVAPGGTGKTLLLLQVCIALAAGVPPLGGHLFPDVGVARAEPAKVVLLVAEETAAVMHERLHAVFESLLPHTRPDLLDRTHERLMTHLEENLRIYPLAGQFRLLLDGGDPQCDGMGVLHDLCSDARLVVIDPLRQFHTGEENDSWVMTHLMQHLQVLACRNDQAVLVAHHTNKWSTASGQGDKAGASRGSVAFTDAVRWQLNLSLLDADLAKSYGIDPQGAGHHVRLDLAKANYLPPQAPVVLKRGKGGAFSAAPAPRQRGARGASKAGGRV